MENLVTNVVHDNDRESSNANFTMISSNESIESVDINKNYQQENNEYPEIVNLHHIKSYKYNPSSFFSILAH